MNGLELDNWIYPLIENSRNGKIQKGTPGFLDASGEISVLEIPAKVDRGMGDVHPAGNPHYILSPYAMRKVFQSVLEFMSQNSPEHKDAFKKNAEAYLKQFDLKIDQWQKKLKPLAGTRIVSFHSSWIYFFNDFGLESGGYMEPVPGIAPSPAHTLELIEKIKKENTKIIFKETFYADDTPALIAEKTGAKVVVLPISIGGSASAQDYFSLIDTLVNGVQP
jgi:zinc/manganese transport system substrate-binding protein